jgi:hypothetical protein
MIGSYSMNDCRFRISFTPFTRVLFTFPSRYSFTIGQWKYLALGGGPPGFTPDYTCPMLLTESARPAHQDSPTGLLPPLVALSRVIRLPGASIGLSARTDMRPVQPQRTQRLAPWHVGWFGLFPVRSSLLRESLLISFPRLLRYFTSPRMALRHLCIQCRVMRDEPHWVAPFGDLRITGC